MYTEAARARRRCTATTKDGRACRGWALWDDPRQRCAPHAGRGRRGPQLPGFAPHRRARYPLCRCAAYRWPHRPGGGLCRWPAPPLATDPRPAGTHRTEWRRRVRRGRVVYERR
jgi:hypothetical protein